MALRAAAPLVSFRAGHWPQRLHENPVSDATTLSTALFVRVPEVNALQDPQLDDIEGGIREAMVGTGVQQQIRRCARDRKLEFIPEVELEDPGARRGAVLRRGLSAAAGRRLLFGALGVPVWSLRLVLGLLILGLPLAPG